MWTHSDIRSNGKEIFHQSKDMKVNTIFLQRQNVQSNDYSIKYFQGDLSNFVSFTFFRNLDG